MNVYRPFAVTLVAREQISPSFVRITLGGPDLATCSPTLLDQRVKLLFGGPEALTDLAASPDWYPAWLSLPDADRPVLRTYTLSAVRPGTDGSGEVDIDVAAHPLGAGDVAPGMRFALEAPLGTATVLVAGDSTVPGHDRAGVAWQPGDARDLVLVGDETALPAIVNIAATLPDDAIGRIIVEVPEAGDVRPLVAPPGMSVSWRVRSRGEAAVGVFGPRKTGAAPATEGTQATHDDDLLWDEATPEAGRYGWVAGEAGWVRSLRAEAKAAGLGKGQVAFMGYWKRGAAGS